MFSRKPRCSDSADVLFSDRGYIVLYKPAHMTVTTSAVMPRQIEIHPRKIL